MSSHGLGGIVLVGALFPLIWIRRMGVLGRRWILGMFSAGAILAAVTMVVLDPPEIMGVQSFEILSWLITPTHVVPTILFGYGLILVGAVLTESLSRVPRFLSCRNSSTLL